MEMKTKYDIFDEFWYMKDGEPFMNTISHIKIFAVLPGLYHIKYGFMEKFTGSFRMVDINEEHVFKTKEEVF